MKRTDRFKGKTVDLEKLVEYGFAKNNGIYSYVKDLCNGDFEFIMYLNAETLDCEYDLIDTMNDENYGLVFVENADGSFINSLRSDMDNIFQDILCMCALNDYFIGEYVSKIVKYIKDKYGDELEFLWENASKDAITRNKKNNKWYSLFVNLPKNKLGLDGEEDVDIMNLRGDISIMDFKTYFPAYHMNKKNWFTILLDGNEPLENVYALIDKSYEISLKK